MCLHCLPKKENAQLMAVTPANLNNRFQKFFLTRSRCGDIFCSSFAASPVGNLLVKQLKIVQHLTELPL